MSDKPDDTSDKPPGASSGEDAPPVDVLARRYLDLWQDQMARMADDPATTDMLARTFTLLTRSAQAYTAAGTPADGSSPDHDATNSPDKQGSPGPQARPGRKDGAAPAAPGPQDGAAPAAPVSGPGGVQLSDLLDRIDALEKRVADLERGSGERGAGPVQPPQSPRPARPAPSTKRRLR